MTLKALTLSLVILILFILGYFVWKVQRSGRQVQQSLETVDISGLRKPENNDMEQRIHFANELKGYLAKRDFSSLERIASEITAQKSRFPGGDWKIMRFFEAVARPRHGYHDEDVIWTDRIAALKEWSGQMPDSIFAAVSLADAYVGSAQDHPRNGHNYAAPDPEEAYRDALSELEHVRSRRSACVVWFSVMQSIGLHQGWEKPRMTEIFEEAAKVEPLYYDIYVMQAIYLNATGAPEEWIRFAEESAERFSGKEGTILYAEICWQVSRSYNLQDFYKQNHVSYSRIRQGFIERTQRYEPSYRYLNAFCLLAGAARDRPTTRILMQMIGDNWEPDFWETKKYFDDYKKWANS